MMSSRDYIIRLKVPYLALKYAIAIFHCTAKEGRELREDVGVYCYPNEEYHNVAGIFEVVLRSYVSVAHSVDGHRCPVYGCYVYLSVSAIFESDTRDPCFRLVERVYNSHSYPDASDQVN